MNSTSVQIALRPVLNHDVSAIISKYYFENMKNDRIKQMKKIHHELLKKVHSRICEKINEIDSNLYLDFMSEYGLFSNEIVDEHDFYHDLLLDIELQLHIKYRPIKHQSWP